MNPSAYFQSFFHRNGRALGLFLLTSVAVWIFMMILLPQVFMLEFSFSKNLPPSEIGGPKDTYTTEHYEFMVYGSAQAKGEYNVVDLSVFARTLIAAFFVTLFDLAICYPIAYYLAQVATGGWARLMVLSLIVPFWVNEILRAFAFRIMFGTTGIINTFLMWLGVLDEPYGFIQNDVALYAGLGYAFVLLMIFPLYNAIESLDKNQIEAARDMGASWIRIHRRVVIPFAKPGITSGCTMVFMLTAGALAAPQILGGPSSLWFTQIIFQWFNTGGNWPRGPARLDHRHRPGDDEGIQGPARGDRAVRSDTFLRICVLSFVALFFAYLFGPLILMGISAFNSSAFPRVSPFECFTVEWFNVLVQDEKLMEGLRNSLFIGAGVVLLAVPIGLAGSLMLTQVGRRVRPWYYTITISPILIPGVVLGISTLVFWDRLGIMFGASYDSIFYNGIFLTVVGQATFISAYSMLVFISRLQRFDPAQEEAALDLGATHVQAFRKVLLPFLKPAIGSAAVLAFLASFENYNTTVFTIVSESTLTTVLASKVRYGINPSISALAVVIVVLTLIGAVFYEILKRREAAEEKAAEAVARGEAETRATRAALYADPAVGIALLVFIAGFGTVYFAGTMGVEECKAAVKEEKRRLAEQRTKRRQTILMFERAAPGAQIGPPRGTSAPKVRAKGTEGYGSVFAPTNLESQVESEEQSGKESEAEAVESPGKSQYQNIFDPGNLKQQVEGGKD